MRQDKSCFPRDVLHRVVLWENLADDAVQLFVPADLEHIDQALVGTRDGFEFLDASKFAFEGSVILETPPVNDFSGAVRSDRASGQPDFAVAPRADAADQLMVRDRRWETGCKADSTDACRHCGATYVRKSLSAGPRMR